MKKEINNRKLITAIGGSHIQSVVFDLYDKAFECYKLRGDNEKDVRVSPNENDYATTCIVLIALSLESLRNRTIYFFDCEGITHNANPSDAANGLVMALKARMRHYRKDRPFLVHAKKRFDYTFLEKALKDIFALRNAIMHAFIFEIEYNLTSDWDFKSYKEFNIVSGTIKGSFKKRTDFKSKVPSRTKLLKLNVMPILVGFEELHTCLFIYNLIIKLYHSILGYKYAPFQFTKEAEPGVYWDLDQVLYESFKIIPRHNYKSKHKILVEKIYSKYSTYTMGSKIYREILTS